MKRTRVAAIAIALLCGLGAVADTVLAQVNSQDPNIAMMDNCDPSNPGWATVGGCDLRQGSVTLEEFLNYLFSPLSGAIPVGHPSWRQEPSYLSIAFGKTLRAKNLGGRAHTLTEVQDFGGGIVPLLNGELEVAPECNQPLTVVAPGGTQQISGLAAGTHKFQCCIHPWMRAAVHVN